LQNAAAGRPGLPECGAIAARSGQVPVPSPRPVPSSGVPPRRILRSAALAAALLAPALPAAAAPFTLDAQVAGNVFGGNGKRKATLNGSQDVAAGGFAVQVTAGDPGVEGLGSAFTAWCLDIERALKLPSSYEVTATPFLTKLLSNAQKAAIRAVFNAGYDAALLPGNDYSAGFQLALWEIVNETSGSFSLAGGSFTATAAAGALTVAGNLLAGLDAAGGAPLGGNWRIVYLQSRDGNGDGRRDSQNLVTVAPVPLPAAGLMLLAALGGMAAARRRRG
jgi:hypothetical protein